MCCGCVTDGLRERWLECLEISFGFLESGEEGEQNNKALPDRSSFFVDSSSERLCVKWSIKRYRKQREINRSALTKTITVGLALTRLVWESVTWLNLGLAQGLSVKVSSRISWDLSLTRSGTLISILVVIGRTKVDIGNPIDRLNTCSLRLPNPTIHLVVVRQNSHEAEF